MSDQVVGGGEDARAASAESDAEIPAVLRAAWGRLERPGRGPKPGLSLRRIVEAGARLADAEGIDAVSMGRVAKELGVSTMALYRYVAAKNELLDLMMDATLGDPPAMPVEEGWRAGLSSWAWAELDVYMKHPWLLRVPISGPPIMPKQIAWLERGLAALGETDLPAQRKLSVILLISNHTRSWGALVADLAAAAGAMGITPDQVSAGWGRMLAQLADPEQFPVISAALADGEFDEDPDEGDPYGEFRFGLERILDGIGVLVSR